MSATKSMVAVMVYGTSRFGLQDHRKERTIYLLDPASNKNDLLVFNASTKIHRIVRSNRVQKYAAFKSLS